MPPKKTETKTEGAAAAKPKASGSQHTYQVRNIDAGISKLVSVSNW
jgi:histone H1/5